MKLLLLEDDADMSAHVMRLLRGASHVVDHCSNGRDAIFLATSNDYSVLILDRLVPGVDGLAALKAIRSAGVQTPALFLTAVQGIADRVDGLDAGADDYLVKPFAGSELLARIAALGRRPPIADAVTRLTVADLEIDLLKRSVMRGGKRVDVQQQEYKLLEYLMRHAGEVVTRTMLLESVWSFHFDPGTNLIESHISRLRAKVDRGFDSELIETVRGAGYRMRAQ
ncbi:MAG: winged helix-turn-helix domain-containing protein [Sphingomicrobium sp.]|nr:response regulator transcription factor [Sphingomonadales bacterium]